MARRKNTLDESELAVIKKQSKSYVETFDEAINLFVKDCELRNLRPFTIKYYLNELQAFLNLLTEQEIDVSILKPYNMTEEHVKENVILYMKNYRGIKVVSINTRLRALRAFYNFLYKQKHIPRNPMENIKLLKDRKRIIPTFSKEQLNKLFHQPNLRTFTGVRDYTIMMLMLETGIRVNELVGLSVKDIRWEDSLLVIRNAKSYRERQVPIQRDMKNQMKKYIAIRGYVETDALFVTIDGTRLTRRGIQQRISIYGNMAQIKDVRCSPHTFRHTFAKLSVQQGANIFELQAILGHTNMEIVKTYVNLFGNDVRDRHKEFSPLKVLNKRYV
ncbi:tyrosine-type recombinase/integrase [Bacillus mycoides]|uniref:tyrosine-type recombinase/integrase n=1 Tax=Bacillus mycoides TaxID=1405 RepID=UPI000991BCCE|nr:tyrosine-type recombinase/integrase [Bacillus mycoides]MED1627912.1 tyrosine-type recombinase/integrase [Bacillus mycoides]OOR59254.1 recombinase XerD [Bacillus mycoides]HDR7643856.1 tyrosine-type recombinase/integrase [Bacillus mycoides]